MLPPADCGDVLKAEVTFDCVLCEVVLFPFLFFFFFLCHTHTVHTHTCCHGVGRLETSRFYDAAISMNHNQSGLLGTEAFTQLQGRPPALKEKEKANPSL